MLTQREMEVVRSSDKVDLEEVFHGRFRLEDMEDYFKREMKENLLEQGYKLPEELKDMDDDSAPIPDYLKERQDPDQRSRYDGIYDGHQEESVPTYASTLYWQWMKVRHGRLAFLRAYNLSGEEIKIPRGLYGEIFIQVRDYLLSEVANPISHKEYQRYQVKREELDLGNDFKELAFVTCYLFQNQGGAR